MKSKRISAVAGLLLFILNQVDSATPIGFQKLYDHYVADLRAALKASKTK